MREAFQFTCEIETVSFGSYSILGHWVLTLDTDDDGFSFRLIDAQSEGWGVSREAMAHIQEGVDFDTAPRARGVEHKSLIRQAYETALIESDDADARADDRGCFEYHQRAA